MRVITLIIVLLKSYLISAQQYTEWFTSRYADSNFVTEKLTGEKYTEPGMGELSSIYSQINNDSLKAILFKNLYDLKLRKYMANFGPDADSLTYHYMHLKSILAFQELRNRSYSDSDTYFCFATSLNGVNLYDDAIYNFTRAIDLYDSLSNPVIDRNSIFFSRGEAKLNKEDYYGAIRDATIAIENAEPFYKYYLIRGKAYVFLREFEKAVGDFTESIKLYDRNIETYYWRGLAYFETGNKQKACMDFSMMGDYGYDNNELLDYYCK